MATFSVPVVQIDGIENHPNADALEIVKIGGFNCIARIGDYQAGDLAVYIPEAAVVPESILVSMNLWDDEKEKGKLAGKQGDRVKAIKLRGVVSQGLLMPVDEHMAEGMDVAEQLGIVKYEPVIPTHMNGEVCNVFGHTLKFDIENIQKHLDVLAVDEEVVMTEKLHGTWTCFGFDPSMDHDEVLLKGTIITSKGLSEQGLAFKWNEANKHNLYVSMFKTLMQDTGIWDSVINVAHSRGRPIYILGETFGLGVQDLHYGLKEKRFLAFGIYIGEPGHGKFMDFQDFRNTCTLFGIENVPVLYRGPFSMDIAEQHRDGKDSITGVHMREGIVITPIRERTDISVGRVCLKMVSPDYLLRKGNTTEFN